MVNTHCGSSKVKCNSNKDGNGENDPNKNTRRVFFNAIRKQLRLASKKNHTRALKVLIIRK